MANNCYAFFFVGHVPRARPLWASQTLAVGFSRNVVLFACLFKCRALSLTESPQGRAWRIVLLLLDSPRARPPQMRQVKRCDSPHLLGQGPVASQTARGLREQTGESTDSALPPSSTLTNRNPNAHFLGSLPRSPSGLQAAPRAHSSLPRRAGPERLIGSEKWTEFSRRERGLGANLSVLIWKMGRCEIR